MNQFTMMFYILSFGISLAVLLVLTLTYLKYRVRLFLFLLLTFLFYNAIYITNSALNYLTVNIPSFLTSQVKVFFMLTQTVVVLAIILSFARFTRELTSTRFNLWEKMIFVGASVLPVVLYGSTSILGGSLDEVCRTMGSEYTVIVHVYATALIVYSARVLIGNIRSITNNLIKTFTVVLLIEFAFFFCVFVIDLAIGVIVSLNHYDIFYFQLNDLFYLVFNITAVVFFSQLFRENISVSQKIDRIPDSFVKNYSITRRESEIALLLLEGKSYKEMSNDLFLSIKTVETHIGRLYRKTGSKCKEDLTRLIYSFHRP